MQIAYIICSIKINLTVWGGGIGYFNILNSIEKQQTNKTKQINNEMSIEILVLDSFQAV